MAGVRVRMEEKQTKGGWPGKREITAIRGRKPVGSLTVTDMTTEHVMAQLIVDEKYRGKGVGRGLIIKCLKSESGKRIILIPKNEPLRAMYLRNGFKEIDHETAKEIGDLGVEGALISDADTLNRMLKRKR